MRHSGDKKEGETLPRRREGERKGQALSPFRSMAAREGSPAGPPRVRSMDVVCACAGRGRAGRRVRTAGIFARLCARHQISSTLLLSLPPELGVSIKTTPPGSSWRVRHLPLLCMRDESWSCAPRPSPASPMWRAPAHASPPPAALASYTLQYSKI